VTWVFKAVRSLVGRLILLIDRIFVPTGVQRSAAAQGEIDRQLKSIQLYHFPACPFCVKVRRGLKRLSLEIEFRDIRSDERWREELIREGGKSMVPCLRIEEPHGAVRWMYESSDILAYLEQRFAVPAQA
jgi:glutaredoxin